MLPRFHQPLFLLAAGLGLAGCATDVADAPALSPSNAPFSGGGSVAAPADWWQAFGDDDLEKLVGRAFAGNPGLIAVWERFRAAEAVARRTRADLVPDLDVFGGATASSSPFESEDWVEAGLSASYEVDLFGRIRSEAEAERLRATAGREDYETAALSLSGEVALAWFRLLADRERLALLNEQIESNLKVLESLQTRFRGGQARGVDVLRQKGLVEATREQRIVVEADLGAGANRLAVLTGQAPQEARIPAAARLPRAFPPLPETGLPGELVLRRPDLRAAYARLLAADADLAAAVSARFPRLDLTAGLRSDSEDPSDLFEDWTRSIAADLIGPVIDGGARRAEAERARAVKRQRLAEFRQACLDAFREVEDALVRERKQAERIRNLDTQIQLQEAAYEQLRREFFNGVSDFIDVLDALTDAQQLRRDRIEAELRRLEFRVALHRSLAGPVGAASHRDSP